MSNCNYYSSGPAAAVLGVSQPRIRKLCNSGLIACEVTSSGQFRIPLSEIERLKREGLPPTPQSFRLPAPTRSRFEQSAPSRINEAPSSKPMETAASLRAQAERLSARREL